MRTIGLTTNSTAPRNPATLQVLSDISSGELAGVAEM